jgi:hypothetical protein
MTDHTNNQDNDAHFESTPLLGHEKSPTTFSASTFQNSDNMAPTWLSSLSPNWFPCNYEDHPPSATVIPDEQHLRRRRRHGVVHHVQQRRSLRRRIFLVLTEPDTSIASALFFGVLVVTISLMNVVMIMQTMSRWQFTPTDCRSCGGPVSYVFDDDDSILDNPQGIACVCPPSPVRWTVVTLDWLVYFFTIEWTLRLITYEPPPTERATTVVGCVNQWLGFLFSASTILDALAIFPYYIENLSNSNGLMPLRLLRLFRIFQLVRLSQYSETFVSLTTVFYKSIPYLKILLGVLLFGAAFFGSLIFWLERGTWEYFEDAESYQFVRTNQHGKLEITPFTSIPSAFWWFIVTSTTVGYGDMHPESTMGKWVATCAMLMGVLVIAFPVSVFSELWSKELRKAGAILDDEEDDVDDDMNKMNSKNRDVQAPKEENRSENVQGSSGKYDPTLFPASYELESLARTAFTSSSSNNTSPAPKMRKSLSIESTYSMDENYLAMHKDDLAELYDHYQSINESQRQIRVILRKYKAHYKREHHPV